ncbi:replicative DNA helicase [Isoptericola sp. CG 20/1183]|uniref:Replicative DNA helicase n=1 Tax=Isoptericola halotolerans TaxID=300560 RepID=A0ABX5EH59_9MICO|nr:MULTISPECIES: replicative DNA helicase [Isoptericola]PRZ08824.1 replicative DNA helicase [Isoptericola halotolerans]PRZ10729.1 replicative DNA helicase [Isoptericola sp. CG 20/1183]
MSIDELEANYSSRGSFDRTPPQDVEAEMSVLGGMLLSKDAIADVVEQIRGVDFYRPVHEAIYDAIIDLYGRGEPADAITVVAELTKRGEIGRIGGASYIHDLMAGVPTAANAGYYARIVQERAVLRRLVEAGTKIVQLGYATDGGDVDAVVNNAQAEIYAVTERKTSEDYAPLADIIGGAMDEIEAAGNRGEGMVGVPTGFADLDRLTNGLHPGQMIVVAARPAMGKALALDTPLPTPTGWTTMGDVAVGDELIAADGTPTRVVRATEVMTGRPCYEVVFDDGTTIVADAWHEWVTSTSGKPADAAVRTTEDILASMRAGVAHSVARPGAAWKIVDVVAVDSRPVRCVEIDHPEHLYLASAAKIPTHNSTLAIDIARSASIKHQKTSVVFSLEMSRNEITMRLLSAEARVHLQKLRNGSLGDDDWQKLAKVMGKVSEAPLFIDDSPNMSLTEIRAKCRRLKQKHDLELVVIDYLQLMTSGKKVESRQQEVSEFSRALKLLAKEIEVPVIALSQLNRGPEQRQDKKPAMSDLRESGCLTEDTKILRADTGAETTMGELFALNAKDVPVWALNERLQYVRRHLTHVFPTGVKQVYRLRLASGKQIEATANHPFLTYEGWTPLGELEVGARLGVPRHVPGPEQNIEWDDRKVVMLAHLLGDGSFVKRQPIRYASIDERNLSAVTDAAEAFGITTIRDEYAAARVTTLRLPAPYRLARGRRNPIAEWLDDMGLFGARSHQKFVPSSVFHLPKHQIALFIKHIWATDGSVTINKNGRSGRIYYASTSRELVDGLSRLLLRFGISTRVRRTTLKGAYRQGYTLDVSGVDDQRRFLQEIGVHGDRGDIAERLLEIIRETQANTNIDTVPRQVWDDVRDLLVERGMTHRQFAEAIGTQFCGSTLWKRSPSRQRLGKIATVLESEELEMMAVNDLLWDEVVEIEPVGEKQVFDATVLDTHNFVANGIAVHNSIEQDADMVILLHREDAYEKESPRAGEADLIVAKHRNGPTDTITVAFQGHYSRFVDMQV